MKNLGHIRPLICHGEVAWLILNFLIYCQPWLTILTCRQRLSFFSPAPFNLQQLGRKITILPVISREITPLATLYSPPAYKKKCFKGLLSGRRGRYAHAYGIWAPFYYNRLKNIYGGGWGGYNAAKGLISRDIAIFYLSDSMPGPKRTNLAEHCSSWGRDT